MLLTILQNDLTSGISPPVIVPSAPAVFSPPFGTALQLITGALRFINQYAPGESLSSSDANDALQTLNDLMESWSTDKASVFASSENILTFVPGKYQYTIGNYDAGQFAGIVTNLSATITGATVPSDMIANSDLIGTGIPLGTTVISTNPGAGTILMSNAATASPGTQKISYTIPGDFKIPRPLRITDSFTRINSQGNGLDYPISIVDQDRYIEIGFKGISAPWPILAWYNPTFPLGNIYFYQNPSDAGELHLFSDSILESFSSLTQSVVLPQGYTRMIKRNLARDLAPEYGAPWSPMQERLAKESYDFVKSLNMAPNPVSKFDPELFQQGRTDAGWILTGGFR